MRVLAGDIGGTHARLAIAEVEPALPPRLLVRRRYDSAHFDGLAAALREFRADPEVAACGLVEAAGLAVAGPVRTDGDEQRARITNLPWEISSAALAAEHGLARLRLVNDFQAVGHGVAALADADLSTLQDGESWPRAVRAVIGAGTGLGQAVLVWRGDRYEALATEGGHADFAPVDEQQLGLWRFLKDRFARVGYERILSGPGLVLLYEFLGGRARPPHGADPAAAIGAAGLSGSDPAAVQALELFVRIYGAQAGNLALSVLAAGGVYLAGGIAPRILPVLRAGFLEPFCAKGRMEPLLRAIPVRVILNPDAGLLGAALLAAGR